MQTLMQRSIEPVLAFAFVLPLMQYYFDGDVDVDANADVECEQSLTVVNFTAGQVDDFHIILTRMNNLNFYGEYEYLFTFTS